MSKLRRFFPGESGANEQLTAIVAMLLLPLFLVEGVTLLNLTSLLTVHAFVGILLIPVIATKLASTSWRMLRYYRGSEEYVLRGPPHLMLRMVVAPVLIASTILLFGTGVWLLAADQTEGTLVGLHKASFLVWVGALGLHVLSRAVPAVRVLRRHVPGLALRVGLATLSLVAGLSVATMTLPAMDHLQDNVSGQVGVDSD
jgi:hypothetical protein